GGAAGRQPAMGWPPQLAPEEYAVAARRRFPSALPVGSNRKFKDFLEDLGVSGARGPGDHIRPLPRRVAFSAMAPAGWMLPDGAEVLLLAAIGRLTPHGAISARPGSRGDSRPINLLASDEPGWFRSAWNRSGAAHALVRRVARQSRTRQRHNPTAPVICAPTT